MEDYDQAADDLMELADEYCRTLVIRWPLPPSLKSFVASIPDVYEPVVAFTAQTPSGREITTSREMPQSMRDRTHFPEKRPASNV